MQLCQLKEALFLRRHSLTASVLKIIRADGIPAARNNNIIVRASKISSKSNFWPAAPTSCICVQNHPGERGAHLNMAKAAGRRIQLCKTQPRDDNDGTNGHLRTCRRQFIYTSASGEYFVANQYNNLLD
jgi:hypothetical protein